MALNPSPSQLDEVQIIQRSFDSDNDRLRVDAEVTAVIGEVEIDISADADSILVYGQDENSDIQPIKTDVDGHLQVEVVEDGTLLFNYNEISAVVSGSETTIISYTVPSGKTSKLSEVSGSGENIAEYNLKVNGDVKQKLRTYFGGSLNTIFNFTVSPTFSAGDIILLSVLHNRPSSADFNGTIKVLEI